MSEIFKVVNESLSMADVELAILDIRQTDPDLSNHLLRKNGRPLVNSIPGHFMIFHRVRVVILSALPLPFWD